MKHIVVGTAGHIDHGKSALVEALTGIDPDRLQEERDRGITIDLGFARYQDGETDLAFVDVPGHDRFVRNMLAGASGIDVVLLVIAADASGDSAAMDVVKRAGNRVGEAIGNLINVLEPHIVVVGGGLGSNAVGSYWESLQSAARRVAWAPSMKDISIVHAIYGDMAGVLGAAISAAKAEKEKIKK